jgi:hypothetical protein
MAVQYAKIFDGTVAAVDITDEKLTLARELGADIVVDARADDPATVLQAHGGADVAVGLAVDDKSFAAAYAGLRRGGRLVLVALPASGTLSIPVFDTVLNGTSVIGSIVGTRADLNEVFALHAAGRTRVSYEVVRAQVRPELVQQRDAGGDLQPGDLVVRYGLQVLDQGPQRVAVRDDEHAAAGQQVRHDRVVPVRQRPRGDVAQGFGTRLRLRRQHGVARVVPLELPGLRGERRRGDVVRAAPEPELPLAVLPEHLVLILALQCPVVPTVEPPGPAHRDPVAVRGGQGEAGGADRAMLQGCVHEGGSTPCSTSIDPARAASASPWAVR